MRRIFKVLAISLSGLLLTIVLLVAAVWWWAGTSGSLGQALRLAQSQFGASAPLSVSGVSGSLRQGGHIDGLLWQQDGLSVALKNLDLAWQPAALLQGRLVFKNISAESVQIDDQRAPSDAAPSAPPLSLGLPLPVVLDQFALAQLRFSKALAAPIEVSQIKGRYKFDGQRHQLDLIGAAFASGAYRGQVALSSNSPLTLSAELFGAVDLAVPGSAKALPLDFKASAKGPLTALDVAASLLAKTESKALPNATLTASITPWAAQPVQQAKASFKDFNLAALWPNAPQTLLSGTASIEPKVDTPALSAWQMQIDASNALAGPWDQKKLPLESLQARGEWLNGAALVRSLSAKIAGGQISAQGQWMSAAASDPVSNAAQPNWQLVAKLENINPSKIMRHFAAPALSGQASVQSRGEQNGIDFETSIRTSRTLKNSNSKASGALLAPLNLQSASAKGNFNAKTAGGTLTLSALSLKTDDAQITGSLQAQTAARAGKADLIFQAPGLNASLRGELRPASGNGQLQLQVGDVASALRWMQQLPALPSALTEALSSGIASGNADLQLQWQGGWKDPQLQASLMLPRLDWQARQAAPINAIAANAASAALSAKKLAAALDPATAVTATATSTSTASLSPSTKATATATAAAAKATQNKASTYSLRNLQASVSGRLSQAQLKINAELIAGVRRLKIELAANAGQSAGVWQGALTQLGLALQDPSLGAGTWRLDGKESVAFKWTPSTNGGQFETAAGQAFLSAPNLFNATNPAKSSAAPAKISWQPLRWRSNEFISAGKITGLPLAWIGLVGGPQLADAGLGGDLIFDAKWDAQLSDTLRLNASLARSSGDITVQAETGGTARIAAGVRQASITLASNGEQLNLALRWDSQRAGNADGKISTRLTRSAESGWRWPADAALDGQLRAQLPRLGVWSVLAPPGWRIRGALATDLRISGNRAAPQILGSLSANDLALRSVVDGLEFGRGRLRATLDGNRMLINEFTLQGAGDANSGGSLSAQGQAAWVNGQPEVQLNAKIERLRASIRTDRQLTVSGNLQASLIGSDTKLDGALVIDRARIVLPEEGTPQLGDDVVVRSKTGISAGSKVPVETNLPPASPSKASSFNLAVDIDLGRDFRVQGKGLNTFVAGQLKLSADSLGSAPRLIGTVNTVGGQYRAYGQVLDVEKGLLRFSGAIDNPALDILAIRPNLTQRVGVQISGTALLPRVRLYAQPELPDAEKLSWLVLGRSLASGGAESVLLQQAALALLGNSAGGMSGGLASAFGLDELSFKSASTNSDGSTAAGAVTLGKRFSQNFYAAYERSVSGALGSLYIFYNLSQRFTVRAQTGQQSAVDLIFTVPYD
jgi:translocation and assembly module TamB